MGDGVDLLELTAVLVDIPSVSHQETRLADDVERRLRAVPELRVERVGDEVVARTERGRPQRVILAGHLDTVPPAGNAGARVAGDECRGVGAADMKGGLAVFLDLARRAGSAAVDLTLVFYTCEEVGHAHSGLGRLLGERPELVAGDVAILGEPTAGRVEAGCQGTLRVEAVYEGVRAHSARPWTGRNAIHRLATPLARLAAYEARRPVIDGCEFHEAMQAVAVEGGTAGNVVPDRAVLTVNHRFAPDRSGDEALAHVRSLLDDADEVRLVDRGEAAPPALDHPVLAALVEAAGGEVTAKLGWTDVARFAAVGIPATNFGPGDPLRAHTADEGVRRAELERVRDVLARVLGIEG